AQLYRLEGALGSGPWDVLDRVTTTCSALVKVVTSHASAEIVCGSLCIARRQWLSRSVVRAPEKAGQGKRGGQSVRESAQKIRWKVNTLQKAFKFSHLVAGEHCVSG